MTTKTKALTPEQMVRSLFQNFPEASASSDLQCVSFSYGEKGRPFHFVFEDVESGRKYEVGIKEAVTGFKKMVKAVRAGEFPGFGLSADFATSEDSWDGYSIDGLAQFSTLGEIIYG